MRSIGGGGSIARRGPGSAARWAAARRAVVVGAAVLLGGGVPSRADPTDASGATDVVAHPDAPLHPERNTLWCVTSQLAWDALADALVAAKLSGPAPRFGPPSSAEEVTRLNRRSYPATLVDPAALAVVGGRHEDGVVARAAETWRRRFGPDAKPPLEAVGPGDVVGAAALAKDLPFTRPFGVHPKPIRFAGGDEVVRAWGIQAYESGPEAAKIAEQVRVYVPRDLEPGAKPSALIAEFTPRDADERIVLAQLPPAATLAATWAAVDERLRTWTPDTVDAGSKVVVPTIRLDLVQRFPGLEGGALEGVPGSRLARFQSRVRFELSERGASVTAESVVVLTLGLHPQVVFDRPFLVALRRVGAPQPYLLLWVADDALLERWTPAVTEAADAKTLAALVGGWVVDPEATLDASCLRERDLGLLDAEDLGFADGATPSDAEVVAACRRKYAEVLAKVSGTLEVAADGDTRLELSVQSDAMEPRRISEAGALRRRDGALWLEPRPAPDSKEAADPARSARVTWKGAELRLVAGAEVIVFRRRP